jgi:tRNA threonylcarbamoyl adenosine modification protein YeaZ
MENACKRHSRNQAENLDKTLILAVETSSRVGSVALASGPNLLGETTFTAPLRHSAEIFPAIVELLNRSGRSPSDLDQVHLSIGPGSFTGLRIAVAAAKAMHLANGVRIVAVDSLDAIAANVKDAPLEGAFQSISEDSSRTLRLATLLDAKRGQFYTAVYEYNGNHGKTQPAPNDDPGYHIPAPRGGFWRKTMADGLLSAAEFQERFASSENPICVAGDGLLYHRDRFQVEGVHVLDPSCWSPHAAGIHRLGWQKASNDRFADPLALVPFYLRGPEVTLRKRA